MGGGDKGWEEESAEVWEGGGGGVRVRRREGFGVRGEGGGGIWWIRNTTEA